MGKEFNLSKRREEVKKLLEAYMNSVQVDLALRMIKNQDKEFIREIKNEMFDELTLKIDEEEKIENLYLKAPTKISRIIDKFAGDFP